MRCPLFGASEDGSVDSKPVNDRSRLEEMRRLLDKKEEVSVPCVVVSDGA